MLEPQPGAFFACAQCKFGLYCGPTCQKAAWKADHKHGCVIKLDQPAISKQHVVTVSFKTGKTAMDGTYRKPDDVAFGEEFYVKIQSAGDNVPLMAYVSFPLERTGMIGS